METAEGGFGMEAGDGGGVEAGDRGGVGSSLGSTIEADWMKALGEGRGVSTGERTGVEAAEEGLDTALSSTGVPGEEEEGVVGVDGEEEAGSTRFLTRAAPRGLVATKSIPATRVIMMMVKNGEYRGIVESRRLSTKSEGLEVEEV